MKPKAPFILLSVLLLLSLGASLVLYRFSLRTYDQLFEVRLDPNGMNGLDSWTAPAPRVAGGPKRLVMYGDSRAQMWPAPALPPDHELINRGIGGQTTAQILGRFDHHVVPLQPDRIILQAGVNDLKTVALFPEEERRIIDDCKANLAAIIDRSEAIGATVIVTTIFPCGPVPLERRPFWSDRIDMAIDEVNTFLRTLERPGVVILDADRMLREDGRLKPEWAHDLLHLNEAGYAHLNVALAEQLK